MIGRQFSAALALPAVLALALVPHGARAAENTGLQLISGHPFQVSLIILAIVVVFLAAAFAWTFTLRRFVARMTEELRDSEERFRDFAEGGSDWFWEMDCDLRFTYLSGSYEIFSGVNSKDVIGRSRPELYARVLPQLNEDEVEHWRDFNQKFEERQSFHGIELKWLRPDGDVRYFVTDGKPVFDKNGVFDGYRGVGSDITERKRTEDELRNAQQTLTGILTNLPGTVFRRVQFPDGGISHEYSEGQLFAGLGLDRAVGDGVKFTLAELILPEDDDARRHAIEESAKTMQPCEYQYRIRLPTGEVRWIESRSRPFPRSNGEIVWDGLSLDITERKRAMHTLHTD